MLLAWPAQGMCGLFLYRVFNLYKQQWLLYAKA